MLFSEATISEIIEKNDIVDVISEYMNLKRSGSSYSGLCPFHSEKTPSFSVSPSKQIFRCFGCGEGGNVVTFIQKIEKVSYVEALRTLAERARIDLQEQKDQKELEKINLRKRLFKVNVEAARFFYTRLQKNQKPMEYLKRRGLSDSIIKRFGLGYSEDAWRTLLDYLTAQGFDLELLHLAGLITKHKEGKGYYDKFRNRVMFPIIDLRGNVIAFGGRVMDDSKPKYLNSPDTPVFNKGYNIYALNYAKKIPNLQNIIIVEGYMDVIALHQYGVNNAVASLGTAFTDHQAKLLKRFSNEIIIAYDSDMAGQTATMKGLSILEKEGCIVKVLTLPSGKDPDEYVRKEGMEAFNDRVKKSMPLIEYKIESGKKGLDMDSIQDRITFTKHLADILKDVESSVEVDAYIKKYAKMQIDEKAIYSELNRLKDKNNNGNYKHNILDSRKNTKQTGKPQSGAAKVEIALLNMSVNSYDTARKIFEQIEPSDFSYELTQKIAALINLKIKEGKTITAGEIISYFENDVEKSKVVEIFSGESIFETLDVQGINLSIEKLKQSKINKRIQELTKKMDEVFQQGNTENANEIYNEIIKLQRMKK